MKNLLKTRLNPIALRSIKAIGAFKELWALSRTLDKDFYAGLKKTTIITSAGSSTRIEGARLSDEEIIARLEGLKIRRIKDRDEAEVAGYIDCLGHVFEHFRELPITEHTIRALHQMMCSYLSEDALPSDQRGAYKNIPNSVVRIDHETGRQEVIFETTPPGIQTETEMSDLVADYDAFMRDPNYDDIEVIAAFVVKFLAIHPFRDGNGRLSRVLTNLCLLRQGYEFCMYSSHEKVVEDNKAAYYIALRQTQATFGGTWDINPWLIFFLRTLERQAEHLKAGIETKSSGELTALEEKTIELIRLHQPATIGFIERHSGIGRPTLKAILSRLQKKGAIAMEGERKGSRYRIK
jgi:Fic family protein